MPIGRRATDQGTGGTTWLPCPTGLRKFEVGDGDVRLSRFKNDKTGEDQYQVAFPLKLTDDEYQRAKDEYDGEISEGEEISGRCWYTCGLTLGWMKAGQYNTTRLADFLVTLLGSKQQTQLRKHIVAGGGPYIDPSLTAEEEVAVWNAWFQWFSGASVWGTVTHRLDKITPGKVWSDFGGPMAVGSLPGQPEPDYQAWGRGKLRMLLLQSGDINEPEPQPEPIPATVATAIEETAPAAEMSAEDKARLAAQYAEIFGKEAVPA